MSDTVANAEARIRVLLNDMDASNYATSQMRMWDMMSRQIQEIGTRIGMGQTWTTGVFSTADGTADYALPTTASAQYGQILLLKDATHGALIEKADQPTIERARETGSTAVIKGFPEHFSLREDTDQTVTVRIYPVPNGVFSIDALFSLLPPVPIALSTDTIPFPRDILTGFEFRVAARCASLVFAEQMQKALAGTTPSIAGVRTAEIVASANQQAIAGWLADSESLIREGVRRINQLKRAPGQVRQHG